MADNLKERKNQLSLIIAIKLHKELDVEPIDIMKLYRHIQLNKLTKEDKELNNKYNIFEL